MLSAVTRRMRNGIVSGMHVARAMGIYRRYRNFTSIVALPYVANLELAACKAPLVGCVVECGVWRGGMSAGLADMLPGRLHYLFDSFEGLPPAKTVDGEAAIAWQRDVDAPQFRDNFRTDASFAAQAMKMSRARKFQLVEGWFAETIPRFKPEEPIAILRLDGDWYDSTMECLVGLYPYVVTGGLVILDDYYAWDGCARALHDYLSTQKLADRIQQRGSVCHLIKTRQAPHGSPNEPPRHSRSALRH